MLKVYAGIDIGGTGTTVGLFDAGRKLLAASGFATMDGQTVRFGDAMSFMDRLSREIRAALGQLQLHSELAGVGIGVPGQVDPVNGVVKEATNLGWREVALAAEMQSRLGVPVRIDHDVRTFAWGEVMAGAAQGCRNVLCLTIGTGIAAGILLNGQLIRGSHYLAGEIGHAAVAGLTTQCACGKTGCLETIVSAPGIARLASQAGLTAPDGEQPITAREVTRMCEEGNAAALEIYRYAAELLADKLETAVALLDPEIVVIGGGVAEAGEFLFAPLRGKLHEQLPWLRGKLRVVKGDLGEKAGLIGALYHILPKDAEGDR
jgi:glucokinase